MLALAQITTLRAVVFDTCEADPAPPSTNITAPDLVGRWISLTVRHTQPCFLDMLPRLVDANNLTILVTDRLEVLDAILRTCTYPRLRKLDLSAALATISPLYRLLPSAPNLTELSLTAKNWSTLLTQDSQSLDRSIIPHLRILNTNNPFLASLIVPYRPVTKVTFSCKPSPEVTLGPIQVTHLWSLHHTLAPSLQELTIPITWIMSIPKNAFPHLHTLIVRPGCLAFKVKTSFWPVRPPDALHCST
jgi:hypothetical protein